MIKEDTIASQSSVVGFFTFGESDVRLRTLLNVAILLSQAGYRVGLSAIDSDPLLLEHCLSPSTGESEPLGDLGFADLVTEFKELLRNTAKSDISGAIKGPSSNADEKLIEFGGLRLRRPSSYLISTPWLEQSKGEILLLPAGGQRPGNILCKTPIDWTRFDWNDFNSNYAGAAYLTFFRQDLLSSLDFLLVSGHASMGEATQSVIKNLADIVVLITDYRRATLDQSRVLSQLITGLAPDGWVNGTTPVILPVAGEVDAVTERQLLEDARVLAQREMENGRSPLV